MAFLGESAPVATAAPRAPNGAVARRAAPSPGGRALLGGVLVVAAAVGLFSAYEHAAGPRRASYVVARRSVAVGEQLSARDLGLATMRLPAPVAAQAFRDPDVLVGATAVGPLAAGQLVSRASVGRRAIAGVDHQLTLPLERPRVVNGLRDGERVDILATYGSGLDAYTTAVARDVLVLAVERSRTTLADAGTVLVTVSLTREADTLAVAHAARAGQITLARAGIAGPQATDPSTYRPAAP